MAMTLSGVTYYVFPSAAMGFSRNGTVARLDANGQSAGAGVGTANGPAIRAAVDGWVGRYGPERLPTG